MYTRNLISRATGFALLCMVAASGCRQPATAGAADQRLSPTKDQVQTASPQPTASQNHENEATIEYESGKKQIELNCAGECYQAKPEELRMGIQRVEHALQLGYPHRVDAYKVLVRGYGDAMATADTEAETHKFEDKKNKAIALLHQLAPSDPEVLEWYAELAKSDDEKVKILQEATRIDPKRDEAQFQLALLLIDRKDFAKGIKALKAAVENALDRSTAENYLGRVSDALKKNGCPVRDPMSWFEGIDKAYFDMRDESTEPQRREFNRKLAGKLAQLPCLSATSPN